MWSYQKKLQYPVKIANPNPRSAQIIISQYGGPEPVLALYPAIRLRLLKRIVDRYCSALPNGDAPDHSAQQPTVRLFKIKQSMGGGTQGKAPIFLLKVLFLQKALQLFLFLPVGLRQLCEFALLQPLCGAVLIERLQNRADLA